MAFQVGSAAAPTINGPLKSRDGSRGQALVEFALVLVPLMFILGAIIQFAFVLGGQIGVTNAVREAARNAAAMETYTAALATTNGHATYVQLTGGTGLLSRNVQAYQVSQLVTSGSPITEVCYTTYTDPAGTTQVKVKVEAYYRHRLFIPIVAGILDGLDGVNDGTLRVGASEEIRVENAPTNLPALSGSPQCVVT
jgi:Flp pilus assembly protein TadG